MKFQRTIAIDPGLSRLGLAVMTGRGRLVHLEVLETSDQSSTETRLRILSRAIEERLDQFRPTTMILEKTWPTQHAGLARVRRVTLLCRRKARERHIPVIEVSVSTVRQIVTGNGWATKAETAQVVASFYPELQIYLRQDRAWKERHFQNLFDAVALAIYSQKTRGRS